MVSAGFCQVDLDSIDTFYNFFSRIICLWPHATWERSQSLGPHLSSIQSSLLPTDGFPQASLPPQTFLPLSVPLTRYSGVLEGTVVSCCSMPDWQAMHGGPNSASSLFWGACKLRIVVKFLNG